jgi:hypothetical protein
MANRDTRGSGKETQAIRKAFLTITHGGRKILAFPEKPTIFGQGAAHGYVRAILSTETALQSAQ